MEVIKFEKNNIPKAWESKETNDQKFVHYGYDNLYPNYLLSLFNDCGTHASIIENKANYITGDGLKYQDGKDVNIPVNASENVKELLGKVIKDYLIFNYFAVEVNYNIFGEPVEYHHVPAHKIRTNKSKTKFWYNEDWMTSRKNIQFERWSKKAKDGTSKIYFFDGYFPAVDNVYTKPEYTGCIKSIATDIAFKEFNLNNIKNHFSVSNIITFFSGSNVSDEAKRKVIADLKASYTGEEGKKIIVDFQNTNGKSAEVKNLSAGDWDKAYQEVSKKVQDDILFAHQVTSPMLFGIKTEGQLGGATELETAYNIFKATYVRVKRDALESALNELFSNFAAITGPVKFGDKPLFNTTISENVKTQVYTINELRAEAGLPALPNGNRLLNEPATAAPAVEPEPEVELEEVKKKSKSEGRKLTEEDYEQIKDIGTSAEDFEILGDADEEFRLMFGLQEDVSKWVIENDVRGLTLPELVDVLKKEGGLDVSGNRLQGILDKLTESGVIKVQVGDDKRIQITPNKTADLPDSDAVTIRYKYILKPGVPGPILLDTSRSFCRKLVENNRLYSREEIQSMSEIFQYSIWDFKGGWWYDAQNDVSHTSCRHTWKPLRVKPRTT